MKKNTNRAYTDYSALAEWFMANTDNPPTTATILRYAMLNYLLQFQ